MATKRYLIIGNGAAGTTAAQHLRELDPNGEICVYSEDPEPLPYFRAALTNYLIGELLTESQLRSVPSNFYAEMKIVQQKGRIEGLDPKKARIFLKGGNQDVYDRLLIATGARCRLPEFPGAKSAGVITFRTLQDARNILALLKQGTKRAVIAGGGPLALEWAQGLQHHGVAVTLLLRGDHLLSDVLDKTGSDLVLARLRMSGIEIKLNDEISEAIADRHGALKAIRTKNGDKLPCQLLGIAFGVVRNADFLQGTLDIGTSGGILVDERLRTSVPEIFAAGDIIELRKGRVMQLWEPAQQQGRSAAYSMCDKSLPYQPSAYYMATRLYDLDFASVGLVNSDPQVKLEIISELGSAGRIAYRKLLFHEDKLVGALLLGDRKEAIRRRGRLFARLIERTIPLGSRRGELLDPKFPLETLLA